MPTLLIASEMWCYKLKPEKQRVRDHPRRSAEIQLTLALRQKCLTATLSCKSLWQEAFVMSDRVKSNTPGSLAPHVSDGDSQLSDLSTRCAL